MCILKSDHWACIEYQTNNKQAKNSKHTQHFTIHKRFLYSRIYICVSTVIAVDIICIYVLFNHKQISTHTHTLTYTNTNTRAFKSKMSEWEIHARDSLRDTLHPIYTALCWYNNVLRDVTIIILMRDTQPLKIPWNKQPKSFGVLKAKNPSLFLYVAGLMSRVCSFA